MKRKSVALLAVLVVVLAVLAVGSRALLASTDFFYGCMECLYDSWPANGTHDSCRQVGNEETGNVQCAEQTVGPYPNQDVYCSVSGSPCFNVTVTGGGGGSGGGGGTGTCYTRPGAWCPASCQVCQPAVY